MLDKSIDTLKRYQRYFKKLIRLEQLEEISFHLNEIRSISGIQREKKGRAILNLNARESGRGLGGVYLVRLGHDATLPDTEIGVGDLVILNTGHPSGDEAQAVVMEKGNAYLTIAYPNPPPGYVFRKKVRLDLFANDITFRRMMEALFSMTEGSSLSSLLLIKKIPRKNTTAPDIKFIQARLNAHQKKAVTESLSSEEIFLIHGPPGTGKTTTLVEAIIQHARKGFRVLATADSNTAVDNMVEKLITLKANVLRVGNPARLNPSIVAVSIDQQINDHPDYQQAEALREKAAELRETQKSFIRPSAQARRGLTDARILELFRKGNTDRGIPHAKLQRMAEWILLQRQINVIFEEARKLEKEALDQMLISADIICATNSAAGSEILQHQHFDVSFIDEATQSMEPSCLIPMVKSKKWILAGDHKQLPPTVLSREASGLYTTLFERWIAAFPATHKSTLRIQYRMHQEIMKFPNAEFYSGSLIASPKVRYHHVGELSGFLIPDHLPEIFRKIIDPSRPVLMADVANGRERQIPGSFSFYNQEEIDFVEAVTKYLMACRLFPEDLGIISPYEQQVNMLKTRMMGSSVEIKSVDGFQGREKEIIILSLVRSNNAGNIGFLNDQRRLNVAITRARRKLIIAGHAATMMRHELYSRLYHSTGSPIMVQ